MTTLYFEMTIENKNCNNNKLEIVAQIVRYWLRR